MFNVEDKIEQIMHYVQETFQSPGNILGESPKMSAPPLAGVVHPSNVTHLESTSNMQRRQQLGKVHCDSSIFREKDPHRHADDLFDSPAAPAHQPEAEAYARTEAHPGSRPPPQAETEAEARTDAPQAAAPRAKPEPRAEHRAVPRAVDARAEASRALHPRPETPGTVDAQPDAGPRARAVPPEGRGA